MPKNSAAENAFGTLGAIFWSIQLVPQMWKSYRTKSTEGLSDWMLLTWAICGVFLGAMIVGQQLSIPLILQPQFFGTFGLLCWAQCLYYGRRKSLRLVIALTLLVFVVCAAAEIGLIYAIRPSYDRGNDAPILVFGILTAVSIPAGLMPQYYEIYKHKEVKGISVPFMVIDFLGAVCSDLSLVFHGNFQVLPAISYTLVGVLDGLIIILAIILNPRAKRRRALEASTTRSCIDGTEMVPSSQTTCVAEDSSTRRNSCSSTPQCSETNEKAKDRTSKEEELV